MGPPWVRAERAATMEAWRRHRGRYRWPNLLFGGLNDAMFGIVGHLLRRPFAFWRFVQVVAPGLTADGGALEYAMFCVLPWSGTASQNPLREIATRRHR